MKIINLIENTKGSKNCLTEHGLSFYIETKHHRLLVDTGASDAFLENADRLGVCLEDVDTVILSHGHYDHSGGIMGFAGRNSKAGILMQTTAIEEYYHVYEDRDKYIGINPEIKKLSQVEYVDGNIRIDEELFLFSGVTGRRLWPAGNKVLAVKRDNQCYQDEFDHEQYLVIEEGGKKVLISGCAHNGILNIMDAYREIYGDNPDVVISGFHMMKKQGYSTADIRFVKDIARELKETDTKFYTGHCTGEIPYNILKEILGSKIEYIHSGDEIIIKKV